MRQRFFARHSLSLSAGVLMKKNTQLGMPAFVPFTEPKSFPMPRTRRTDFGLNAVVALAVLVILTYVVLGPPA